MRDPRRIDEILAVIRRIWHSHPDLRLGQLLENARSQAYLRSSMYFMEDDDLNDALQLFEEYYGRACDPTWQR